MGWRRWLAGLFIIAMLLARPLPTMAASIDDITDQLMCQCGCNLVLSPCNMMDCGPAADMTERIRQELAAGRSEDEIIAGFVADYGDQVLSAPTKEGFNLVAWITPFGALVVGAGLVYLLVQAWARRGSRPQPVPPSPQGAVGDEAYRRRLERELEEFARREGRR